LKEKRLISGQLLNQKGVQIMKKHQIFISMLLSLVFIVTLLGGCGTPSKEANTPASTETTTVKNEPKTVVPGTKPEAGAKLDENITVVQALDMVSFDPINTSDLSNGYVINNIYSKLFDFNEDLNSEPELVESYKMISDTEWQFKIYKGVKCHDGQELTADDVVYSLQRTQKGTAIGALFKPVDKISKVDDYTIDITTKGPYPALPTALTHQACCIVPMHYAEKAVAANDWSSPIGTGRYTFKSRLIGDNIVMERFDGYFNQDDKACNKSLTFKIIPEGSARTIAVETKTADLNVVFDTVDYDRVMANPDVQLWQHYSQTVWHLGYDNTQKWFDNKLVRQAINFAIDHKAVMEVGHNGHGTVVYNCSTIAPTCLGALENPNNMYSYDPDKAKALMKEAGCTGFDTEIIVFRDEAERMAVLIQSYLEVNGIKAKVTRIENAVFASTIAAHKAPMFITSWGCYWDPDMFLARRFTQAGIGGVNRVWYLNPELDTLITKGRASFDNKVRAGVYEEIQKFMADEAPECDLYVNTMYALATKDLKGVEINVEMPYHYYKLHY
jgi:peptide/nickel transport system substrate-binding protein